MYPVDSDTLVIIIASRRNNLEN